MVIINLKMKTQPKIMALKALQRNIGEAWPETNLGVAYQKKWRGMA